MPLDFNKEAVKEINPDLLGLPPTDWNKVIENFVAKDERVLSLELTGRDKHRSLASVYTSLNATLRKARQAGKPYPVKVSRNNGFIFLYRTDLKASSG